MAAQESRATDKALQQIEERVTCAICWDRFTQPKLLRCLHVYCMKCVQPLVREGPRRQRCVACPQCRQTTVLPPSGVPGLQGAFYIEHLLEIQDTLQKVNSSERPQCEKCKKREAAGFCRSCGFICQLCQQMHQKWENFSTHNMISLSTLTKDTAAAMAPPLKKTMFCSKHVGKEVGLYCHTCDELICGDCTLADHSKHEYNSVEESFTWHKAVIESGLELVEERLATMDTARQDVCIQRALLTEQKEAIEADICSDIDHLKQVLETRKAALLSKVRKKLKPKLANLSKQEKEIEAREEQLRNCSDCVRESLRTGSQKEILFIKKPVMEKMTELMNTLKVLLVPTEQADLRYRRSSPSLAKDCRRLGKVYRRFVCPEQCVASGAGVKAAVVGEVSSVCVQTRDEEGIAYEEAVEDLQIVGELVSDGQDYIRADVKRTADKKYELTYQPEERGPHQLHITIQGQAIMNSPFSVTVLPDLIAPTNIIEGLCAPWGIAIREREDVIVAEINGGCVTTISCDSEKKSFDTCGSGAPGFPIGMAVDGDGNIIVADWGNHRIQQFSSTGKLIRAVGKRGKGPLQFDRPTGVAINPYTCKIYVADSDNGRVQILNSDLTFNSSFGQKGHDIGEFHDLRDIAIDSIGNIYVADHWSHKIQVFSPDGIYIHQFRYYTDGELKRPTGIAIDSNDVVYVTECGNNCVSVFTSDGEYIKTFGSEGTDPGQFIGPCGIAVDGNGVMYVCDTSNNRLQIF